MGNDRPALARLAAEIKAFEADLERSRRFLDLVDQAHQAEIRVEEVQSAGPLPVDQKSRFAERQPARAVPFLLEALACYEVLERGDWCTSLEQSVLRKGQVEQIRRTAYEELLWLAKDLTERHEDHRTGEQLSPESAARRALAYFWPAERAYPPTQGFYQLRANDGLRLLPARSGRL